jgi:hypothetical protein
MEREDTLPDYIASSLHLCLLVGFYYSSMTYDHTIYSFFRHVVVLFVVHNSNAQHNITSAHLYNFTLVGARRSVQRYKATSSDCAV